MSRPVVAVIGGGFLGCLTAVAAAMHYHDVVLVEANPEREAERRAGKTFGEPGLAEAWKRYTQGGTGPQITVSSPDGEYPDPDWTVICVDTPTDIHGRQSIASVIAATKTWIERGAKGRLVIRSTVPPGTTRQISILITERLGEHREIYFIPEFLAEGEAMRQIAAVERIVIGVWPPPNDLHPGSVEEIPEEILGAALATGCPITTDDDEALAIVSWDEAEMIKLGSNAMLASRLTTINSIAAVAGAVGARGSVVAAEIGTDPRIGPLYLKPGAGWGGSCLPKDTRSLAWVADLMGVEAASEFLWQVCAANEMFTDWTAKKVCDILAGADRKMRVVWLGIAFKPGVEDYRNSPALDALTSVVEWQDGEHEIIVYDECGWPPEAVEIANRLVVTTGVVRDPKAVEIARGADIIVLANGSTVLHPSHSLVECLRAPTLDGPTVHVVDPRGQIRNPKALASKAVVHQFGAPTDFRPAVQSIRKASL